MLIYIYIYQEYYFSFLYRNIVSLYCNINDCLTKKSVSATFLSIDTAMYPRLIPSYATHASIHLKFINEWE